MPRYFSKTLEPVLKSHSSNETVIPGEVVRGLPNLGKDSIVPELLNFATMRSTTLPDFPTILTMSQDDFTSW